MKTNKTFKTLRTFGTLIACLAMTACGPDARLDMVGMFVGTSPTIDERFEQSQTHNQEHGFATLKAPIENYRVYVCTDTHVTNTQKRWTHFIESYRRDLLCPVAVHLGDIIDAQNFYDEMYSAYQAVPNNPLKSDTLMAIAGNHDIYFKQWPKFIELFKTCAYYFVVRTPSGKEDLFVCYDSADGTVGSKQLKWLEETLEWADTQDFRHIVACTHTHFFKRDGSQGLTSNYTIEETYALLNLFSKYGVEMLWSGHDHSREISQVKGITCIIVDSMKDSDKKPFYMLVTMGEEIDYEFVAVD
jgi:predicted phosphodiesterase